MRRPHWLKPNRGVELPVHCIFFDTETKAKKIDENTEEARLWFGWAAYVRRYRDQTWSNPTWTRFATPNGFWKFVGQHCKQKRKLYLFAHNLGFDFTVVKGFARLRRTGWENTGRIVDDPPTVLRFRKDECTICFIDTLNYFRLPLAQVGEYVGQSKLPMPEVKAGKTAWDIYCKADVTVLVSAMISYWRMVYTWDLGNFAFTLPAQGFAAFRHRFMETPIFIDDNEAASELSRKAYVGARTECFRIGKLPFTVHCLDINSQYPFIMATKPVPTRLVTTLTRSTVAELSKLCTEYCVVAEITLITGHPLFPKKIPGWTIFPVGKFRTVLNTPELILALSAAVIECVHRVVVYEKAVIFKDYVNFFYEQRMEAKVRGDETLAWLCKLMMNSLYGKWGQNGRKYENKWHTQSEAIKTWLEWDADTHTIHRYRQFAGVVDELQREAESRESFPAISGHITSSARVLLNDYIAQAGPGNTIYCDTDSLFVSQDGFRNLTGRISESQLGWLKHEWESDDVTIYGCKDYRIGERLKRKGIRSNADTLAEGVYRQHSFRGFKGMIQDGDLDRMLIRKVTKHLSRVYSKGTIDDQGFVHPLVFPHPDFPDP